MNFNNIKLEKNIKDALEILEYKTLTPVQEKVIPEALLNKDLIVKSQTGTGKTAAFVIPICEKVIWEENEPQALILTPTRELAIQISKDIKNIGRFKRIKATAIYGKAPFKEQEMNLKGKCHIVVGTPGRILDHIDRKTLVTNNVKYLVIDEADEMLNMGFIKQVEMIVRKLSKKRVTMLFSATMPDEVLALSKKYMNRPININIANTKTVSEKIENVLYRINGDEKLYYLNKLLLKEKPDSCVVFCKTKENVDSDYDFLKEKGYSVEKIHGGMLQKDRIAVMERFKKGEFRILIATDIAARGIDVSGLTHVINIDIPQEKEAYVHRIGRTARAGKNGKAITFVTQYEQKFLDAIEELIGFKITEKSKEEIEISKDEEVKATEYLKNKPKKKEVKNVSKGITKIYFNGGKKKKIRAVDFVGTICSIEGLKADDIGIIEIGEMGSYVEILNGKGDKVIKAFKELTIKGKKLKVEKAKK